MTAEEQIVITKIPVPLRLPLEDCRALVWLKTDPQAVEADWYENDWWGVYPEQVTHWAVMP